MPPPPLGTSLGLIRDASAQQPDWMTTNPYKRPNPDSDYTTLPPRFNRSSASLAEPTPLDSDEELAPRSKRSTVSKRSDNPRKTPTKTIVNQPWPVVASDTISQTADNSRTHTAAIPPVQSVVQAE